MFIAIYEITLFYRLLFVSREKYDIFGLLDPLAYELSAVVLRRLRFVH
jgi:hypothetical protein